MKYHYRVCAENAAGVSDPADKLGPLLADDCHGVLLFNVNLKQRK